MVLSLTEELMNVSLYYRDSTRKIGRVVFSVLQEHTMIKQDSLDRAAVRGVMMVLKLLNREVQPVLCAKRLVMLT